MSHYVYRYLDARGCALYVGCTNNPQKRARQHEAAGPEWWESVAGSDVVAYPSKRAALDAERRAIELESPIGNVRYVRPEPARKPRSVVQIHGYATRVIREARGRKVADLAVALGVDRSYITHIENGTKRRVSAEFYAALCRELLVEDHRALLAVAPEREYVGAPEQEAS